MLTLLFILAGIGAATFLWAVFFGKPSKDEPLYPIPEDHEIVWRKLDDHEKALSE